MTNEILNTEQLDMVSGGNINDRSLLALLFRCYYDINGGVHGQIIDYSGGDLCKIMQTICDKAGVEFKPDDKGLDQYKINGQWRDGIWMVKNRQETLDFFDKKFGIR